MNQHKTQVYIDYDGTIVNSAKRMTEILNQKFNTNCNWKQMKQYNAQDLFPTVTQHEINELFSSNHFFNEKLELKLGINQILKLNEKYFDFTIVTMGTDDNLILKKKWCENNLKFKFDYIGLTDFSKLKSTVDMTDGIMVDDTISMLLSTNAPYKILIRGHISTEWNDITELMHRKDLYVKDNWFQINNLLHRIRKGKI